MNLDWKEERDKNVGRLATVHYHWKVSRIYEKSLKKIVVVKVMMSHSSMKLGKFDILIFFSEQSPNPKSLQNASKARRGRRPSSRKIFFWICFQFFFVATLVFFLKVFRISGGFLLLTKVITRETCALQTQQSFSLQRCSILVAPPTPRPQMWMFVPNTTSRPRLFSQSALTLFILSNVENKSSRTANWWITTVWGFSSYKEKKGKKFPKIQFILKEIEKGNDKIDKWQ